MLGQTFYTTWGLIQDLKKRKERTIGFEKEERENHLLKLLIENFQ